MPVFLVTADVRHSWPHDTRDATEQSILEITGGSRWVPLKEAAAALTRWMIEIN